MDTQFSETFCLMCGNTVPPTRRLGAPGLGRAGTVHGRTDGRTGLREAGTHGPSCHCRWAPAGALSANRSAPPSARPLRLQGDRVLTRVFGKRARWSNTFWVCEIGMFLKVTLFSNGKDVSSNCLPWISLCG